MFSILFGSFGASQAIQQGPDMARSRQAAVKVYSIIDKPSQIDVLAPDQDKAKKVIKGDFEGRIEFKDVWFRYPTRPQ